MSAYTEDHLVEQPAIQLKQHELGWDVVNCYSEWDGGKSALGRDEKREVVLTGRLKPALHALNPDLPVEAIEGAVEDVAGISLETLLRGTCEKGRLLDLIENFTRFSDSKGGVSKLLAKNHQFLGVNRVVAALVGICESEGKVAIFGGSKETLTPASPRGEELTVFDILTRPGPDLTPVETEAIKKVCKDLLVESGVVAFCRDKFWQRILSVAVSFLGLGGALRLIFRNECLNALKMSGNQTLVVCRISDESSSSHCHRIDSRRPPPHRSMKHGTAITITIIVSVLFAVFFIYPAGMVVKQAFEGTRADGSVYFTLDFFASVFRNPIYREGLWNAFALGITSTLATLVIAFPLALIGHRYDFFGKPVLGVLVLAPMILPPFVGAVGVKQMMGVNGSLNALLINTGLMDAALPYDWLANGRFVGIVLMNALHLYPILYMNIAAALSNLDPAMEQAAENLGCPPWKRFFRITLPLAMPGVFAGASIVFIWAFTELGVPLVFDFARVAPVQIFDGLKSLDKNPIPYALTAILLIVAAAVFALSKLVMGRSPLGTAPKPPGRSSSLRVGGWKSAACSLFFLGVFLIASIPHLGVLLLSLAGRWYGTVIPDEFTLHHYVEALGNGLVVPSIQNSLMYAGCATLVALVIGLSVAWVVVRSDLKSRNFLDAVVMLPLAVPGLVMAFGYLSLSQEGEAFHFLVGVGGSPFLLIVVAYAFRRLPYVVRSAVAGLQQSNPALEEAAKSLGATPLRTLRRVAIPLISANLAAGAILAFAFAMLEVSDSLILAQQAQHYPITKAIYTLLSTLGNGTELAAALGVWAMVFLSVAMMGAAILGGKRGGLFKV